jgi:hypothetical protein
MTSDTHSDIITEIINYKIIQKNINIKDFIQKHELKKHELKNADISEFPDNVYFGNTYLINNNSIIKFYSHMTNETSNIYFFKYTPTFYYKCIITFIKISDIELRKLNFKNQNDIISYSSSDTEKLIKKLLDKNYYLYS